MILFISYKIFDYDKYQFVNCKNELDVESRGIRMKPIKKMYHNREQNPEDVIYILSDGTKIIKYSSQKVKKFNIDKCREIDYIPENFEEVQREPTSREKRELEKSLRKDNLQNSFLYLIVNKIKKLLNIR